MLLEQGASVDSTARRLNGVTPLHLAAFAGRAEVVRLLLESGASVHAVDRAANTPLHLSATAGHVAVSRLLLERGASVRAVANDGATPLQVCPENKEELREMLARRAVESSPQSVLGAVLGAVSA